MSQICFLSKIIFLFLKCICRLISKNILDNLILLQMPYFTGCTEWIVMLNKKEKKFSGSMDAISLTVN